MQLVSVVSVRQGLFYILYYSFGSCFTPPVVANK